MQLELPTPLFIFRARSICIFGVRSTCSLERAVPASSERAVSALWSVQRLHLRSTWCLRPPHSKRAIYQNRASSASARHVPSSCVFIPLTGLSLLGLYTSRYHPAWNTRRVHWIDQAPPRRPNAMISSAYSPILQPPKKHTRSRRSSPEGGQPPKRTGAFRIYKLDASLPGQRGSSGTQLHLLFSFLVLHLCHCTREGLPLGLIYSCRPGFSVYTSGPPPRCPFFI